MKECYYLILPCKSNFAGTQDLIVQTENYF
jgi:hypothetical protein